jgi:hypothetical protein
MACECTNTQMCEECWRESERQRKLLIRAMEKGDYEALLQDSPVEELGETWDDSVWPQCCHRCPDKGTPKCNDCGPLEAHLQACNEPPF